MKASCTGTGLFLLGALTLASTVQAAYVTDKLAVGVYDAPGDETPGRVLTSGTPLEILDRGDRLCKVRLGDGERGWLECRYVTDEKPARTLLVETQAQSGQLWAQMEGLKRQLAAKQLQLQAAERIIAQQGGVSGEEPETCPPPDSAAGDESDRQRDDTQQQWSIGGLLSALLGATGGFVLGALLLFWRCRRRFGGLRI